MISKCLSFLWWFREFSELVSLHIRLAASFEGTVEVEGEFFPNSSTSFFDERRRGRVFALLKSALESSQFRSKGRVFSGQFLDFVREGKI